MKRFFSDIKYVFVALWAKYDVDEMSMDGRHDSARLTMIARGIAILAFMSLLYLLGTLFELIRWIVL